MKKFEQILTAIAAVGAMLARFFGAIFTAPKRREKDEEREAPEGNEAPEEREAPETEDEGDGND